MSVFSDLGRPRSNSLEAERPSKQDHGSFTVTHIDVPHKQKRAKSLGNIRESLKGIDGGHFNLRKFLLSKSGFSCSSESIVSTKSRSSSVCEEIIYEEDEEGTEEKAQK